MIGQGMAFQNTYKCECWRDGKLVWEEERKNIVVNEGLDDVLEQYFKGAAYTAQHFIGLKGVGTIAAADTLASHAGWAEETVYDGDRKPIVFGAVNNQVVSNVNNRATFSINAGGTIAGIMITTVATGNVGKLFGAVDFSANRPVIEGDSLVVTTTFTQRTA